MDTFPSFYAAHTMKVLLVLLFAVGFGSSANVNRSCGYPKTFDLRGDVSIAFIVSECGNGELLFAKTSISSAIWVVDQMNHVGYAGNLRLGLTVYTVCKEPEYLASVFKTFRESEEYSPVLAVVTNKVMPKRVQEVCKVFELGTSFTTRFWTPLVKAAVKVLDVMEWKTNVTVVVSNKEILNEFYKYTRREWICVRNAVFFHQNEYLENDPSFRGVAVVFGTNEQIRSFLNRSSAIYSEDLKLIVAPTDGTQISDLPESAFVIQHYHPEYQSPYSTSSKMIPSPLLFEVADPIINLVQDIPRFIQESCNETIYKVNCFRNKHCSKKVNEKKDLSAIANILSIDTQQNKFTYNVFRVENVTVPAVNESSYILQTFVKVFSYDMFSDVLTNLETQEEFNTTYTMNTSELCSKPYEECILECVNYAAMAQKINDSHLLAIRLRPEPWVFGFWVLSFLGMLFCISIIVFLFVKICRRDILEGNPLLTIILLITTTFMFFSVIPFTVEGNKQTQQTICIIRVLCLTLSYASSFSLLLGRSILLASVSKEIGFMSHIAGVVQSFLSFFIFAVQCALSIYVFDHCQELFKDASFLYFMSYNIILIALIMCFSPLVAKSRRNYREGKYFTIASSLIGCTWSCWIPAYAVLTEEWRDPLLCFGLVSTASIILGSVFIPRTYLVTIAETRDKVASALPSLATMTSQIDVYAGDRGQPIYDCVNVAAINAATVIRSTILPGDERMYDSYRQPSLQDDAEFDIPRTPTPITVDDKVTRF